MTLIERLKKRYPNDPAAAALALGLDAALATDDWSPEAREAAAKARAKNAGVAAKHGYTKKVDTPVAHKMPQSAKSVTTLQHPTEGHHVHVYEHEDGGSSWRHTAKAGNQIGQGGTPEALNEHLSPAKFSYGHGRADPYTRDSRHAHDSKGKLPMTLRLSPQGARLEGALATYLTPRIATDAKLPDLRGILSGAPTSNRVTQFAGIVNAIKASAKLATDADLDDLTELLEAVAKLDGGEEDGDDGMSTEANSAMPMTMEDPEAEDDEHPLMAKVRAFCEGKLSPEDCAKLDEMIGEEVHEPAVDEDWDPGEAEDARMMRRAADAKRRMGQDESDEEREKREREDKAHDAKMRRAYDALMIKRATDARRKLGRDEKDDERMEREEREKAADRKRAMDARAKRARDAAPAMQPPGVTKEAMDAAIKTAVDAGVAAAQAKVEAKHVALADVRQWLGNVQLAADSAESVYRQALKTLHVPDAATIHESALKALLHAQPKPGVTVVRLATDAAIPEDIASRYPNSARVTRLGA